MTLRYGSSEQFQAIDTGCGTSLFQGTYKSTPLGNMVSSHIGEKKSIVRTHMRVMKKVAVHIQMSSYLVGLH